MRFGGRCTVRHGRLNPGGGVPRLESVGKPFRRFDVGDDMLFGVLYFHGH